MNKQGDGSSGPSAARAHSVGSRTSCTRSIQISSRPGTPSATPAPVIAQSTGWKTTRSSTSTRPRDTATSIPSRTYRQPPLDHVYAHAADRELLFAVDHHTPYAVPVDPDATAGGLV